LTSYKNNAIVDYQSKSQLNKRGARQWF